MTAGPSGAGPLAGTVALVTGASSGIGAAVAVRLATDGATVALVGRDRSRLALVHDAIGSFGGTAVTLPADVADLASITAAVEQTCLSFGHLDIVVSAAGTAILAPFGPLEPGSWQSMIDSNFSGFVNTAHSSLPHLLASAANQPRGVADLVAISSTAGRRPLAGNNVYSATKHAVSALCESIRQEVTERSVRVGLVSPGMVDTPMTADLTAAMPFGFLSVDDVVDAVMYLLTRAPGVSVNDLVLRSTAQAV